MEQFIITDVHIQKVRHLENIDIEIAPNKGELRHLILTGKNGSGIIRFLTAAYVIIIIRKPIVRRFILSL